MQHLLVQVLVFQAHKHIVFEEGENDLIGDELIGLEYTEDTLVANLIADKVYSETSIRIQVNITFNGNGATLKPVYPPPDNPSTNGSFKSTIEEDLYQSPILMVEKNATATVNNLIIQHFIYQTMNPVVQVQDTARITLDSVTFVVASIKDVPPVSVHTSPYFRSTGATTTLNNVTFSPTHFGDSPAIRLVFPKQTDPPIMTNFDG
ncbi:MAG: hypothetical protein EZS28_052276, partial [Streblomastix strix]